jgi:hypothetical protein
MIVKTGKQSALDKSRLRRKVDLTTLKKKRRRKV